MYGEKIEVGPAVDPAGTPWVPPAGGGHPPCPPTGLVHRPPVRSALLPASGQGGVLSGPYPPAGPTPGQHTLFLNFSLFKIF